MMITMICIRFAELYLEAVTHNQSGNYSCTVTMSNNVAVGYGILTVTCKLIIYYVLQYHSISVKKAAFIMSYHKPISSEHMSENLHVPKICTVLLYVFSRTLNATKQ